MTQIIWFLSVYEYIWGTDSKNRNFQNGLSKSPALAKPNLKNEPKYTISKGHEKIKNFMLQKFKKIQNSA